MKPHTEMIEGPEAFELFRNAMKNSHGPEKRVAVEPVQEVSRNNKEAN